MQTTLQEIISDIEHIADSSCECVLDPSEQKCKSCRATATLAEVRAWAESALEGLE